MVKIVSLVRDMRPWQAGHKAALPDAVADTLIAAGDAIEVAHKAGDIVFPADGAAASAEAPPGRYLTRRRR